MTEWAVCGNVNVVLLAERLELGLLQERMRLDLVNNLCK